MPVISTAKVLVSGANGFIATWVVRTLLEQGFAVRGAVRSVEKCGHLRDTFAAYGEKLELVVVPDITQEGAFDEAVKGVDAIEHMASPVHLNAENPDEIIAPTVKGTLSMLNSAMKHGESVKRVVLTSSTATVLQDEPEPKTFSESDWNEQVLRDVSEKGSAASGHTKYRAAKVLGERAAWEFVEKHKDKLGWDLVVLNPPYVFGPTIHAVSSPEALNLSTREFYKIFTQPSTPVTLQAGNCWVDVRDLARAQVSHSSLPQLAVNVLSSAPALGSGRTGWTRHRTRQNTRRAFLVLERMRYTRFSSTRVSLRAYLGWRRIGARRRPRGTRWLIGRCGDGE